jgi:DNA-directed RNA polymerase specialized sigma24 family protein
LLERKDVIHAAILAAYEGRRRWPEHLELVPFLCGVTRSIASHILTKKKQHPPQSTEDTSELELLHREDSSAFLQLSVELRDLVSHDQLLSRIVAYRIEDPALKPRDLKALMSDVSMIAIRNAYRRLNKLIRKLEKEEEHGEDQQTSNAA